MTFEHLFLTKDRCIDFYYLRCNRTRI